MVFAILPVTALLLYRAHFAREIFAARGGCALGLDRFEFARVDVLHVLSEPGGDQFFGFRARHVMRPAWRSGSAVNPQRDHVVVSAAHGVTVSGFVCVVAAPRRMATG